MGVHFKTCTLPGDESLDTLANVHTIPAVLIIQPIIYEMIAFWCMPSYILTPTILTTNLPLAVPHLDDAFNRTFLGDVIPMYIFNI